MSKEKELRKNKVLSFKEDNFDLYDYLSSLPNASMYVIDLIRKDLEQGEDKFGYILDRLNQIDSKLSSLDSKLIKGVSTIEPTYQVETDELKEALLSSVSQFDDED